MNLFDGILIDGVFMSVGDHFAVRPNGGMMTLVGSGRAWFNGTWSYNSTDLIVRMPEPELVYQRIDAIVLEIDKRKNMRRNRICVIKGTPAASNPAKPKLTKTDDFAQYALAYVNIKPEALAITALDIENVVGHEETPYATGLIQVHNVDAIWSQWEARFNEWLDGLRSALEGDVAGNLLAMIQRLEIRVTTLETESTIHTGNGAPPSSLGSNKNFYYDFGGNLYAKT